jgi:hypothetical protein
VMLVQQPHALGAFRRLDRPLTVSCRRSAVPSLTATVVVSSCTGEHKNRDPLFTSIAQPPLAASVNQDRGQAMSHQRHTGTLGPLRQFSTRLLPGLFNARASKLSQRPPSSSCPIPPSFATFGP